LPFSISERDSFSCANNEVANRRMMLVRVSLIVFIFDVGFNDVVKRDVKL
jgi:hypothetical protein